MSAITRFTGLGSIAWARPWNTGRLHRDAQQDGAGASTGPCSVGARAAAMLAAWVDGMGGRPPWARLLGSPKPVDALRRLARGRRWSVARRVGLSALIAAGLAAAGLEAGAGLLARTPATAAPATAPWIEVVRPIALYGLAGTEFAKLPATYRARRRPADDAREDVMTFGALGTPAPFLQLSLLRAGADGGEPAEALADGLAKLAASRNMTAGRFHAGAPVDTGLGRFATAELLVWDHGDATPCLGFRGPADAGGVLKVSGFACGAPGRPVGRAALACAIDRIDLVSAGEDEALRSVFVAAERRGGSTCLASPALGSSNALAAIGRRFGWLDPGGDLPPLRGALLDLGTRRR